MYKSKKPYFYGTGRRKSSVARVHLFPNGTGAVTINGRDIDEYFGLETLKLLVRQPLVTTGSEGKFDIVATVSGGGVTGQAGAIRHGVARALLLADENNRAALKAAGFLTRDPRMKERKKYGLKAARRAPQFSKRDVYKRQSQERAAVKKGNSSSTDPQPPLPGASTNRHSPFSSAKSNQPFSIRNWVGSTLSGRAIT